MTADQAGSMAREYLARNPIAHKEEAIAGWMPTGAYCPNGCYAIYTTPIPEEVSAEPIADPDGIQRPAGIRFADLMRDGGSYALCYDSVDSETVKRYCCG